MCLLVLEALEVALLSYVWLFLGLAAGGGGSGLLVSITRGVWDKTPKI